MSVRVIAALGALAIFAGCAEERPPIDRVQPNGIPKALFEGEWYYGRTVVDVPAANGFTHVGDTDYGGLARITWDLQEDFLYARRTTELIKGADDKVDGQPYDGEVIAAFRVQKHFDIIAAYNPTTGEKLNIREENSSDRPWYERAYVRVDWSQNLVHNYQLSFERQSVESVPYYVQEIDPRTGERHPDAPHFAEDGSYFDVTTKLFARAGTFYYPGFGEIPVCWLLSEPFSECGAGEFTIRHSFLKLDPERQYEPLVYKGKSTEVFGYFTTDRQVYDGREGIREQNKERYLNRHNLWKKWFDEKGNPLPYTERELRPIVYHVNTEFPDWLKPVAHDVARQWNEAFTDTVKALGHEPKGDVFIVCPNNPVAEGDPAECGAAGTSPRLGDIRYSFMAYVPKYMTYGLLGLGPSNSDPETGEIISGMGYVYHHNNVAAYQTQEMIELLNGERDAADFIDGVDLTDWREKVNQGPEALSHTFGLEEADYMVERIAHSAAVQYWDAERLPPTQADFQAQLEKGFWKWAQPFVEDLYRRGIHNGERHSPEGRLQQLAGTYIEELLVDDELLMGMGHDPALPVGDDVLGQVSVARGGLAKLVKHRARLREMLAERHNKYLPEMADDALMGIARELKGKKGPEVYETVRTAIYTAVLAHEVGHSLGLMHNFGGSDDAINYHDEYWHIRDDGDVRPRLVDPITDDEINQKIYNYAYSSVMDYAGRYTIDGKGIGKYDRAAILFGYAGKVEVFEDNGDVPHGHLQAWYDNDGDILLFDTGAPTTVHYTSFYNRMGEKLYSADNRKLVDVSTLSADFSRAEVDGETYSRVPYIYCSHNRANLSDRCLTRDFGADSAERMKNILDELNTWYVTRNFPRGVAGVDQWGYVPRWYGRIYDRLKQWHNLYGLIADLLGRFYTPAQLQAFLTDAESGYGIKTWAVQNAFNYLVQTLLMPNVGEYGGPYRDVDGTAKMLQGVVGANTRLDVSQARYFSTSWGDGDRECGYMWWECLHHIGFYLDKIMAIEALSDSSTNFVARATPEDLRQWEISYYSTFGEQIARINEAMLSQEWSRVGPYYEDGKLKFPNYAGRLDEAHNAPVDPYATFTVQLYWQVLGQARFIDNFDQSFRDESRVFVIGSGSAPDIDPERLVTFTDPQSGITYGALRFPGRTGGAHAVLSRAMRLLPVSSYCDEGQKTPIADDDCANATPGFRNRADYALLDHIELIKVLADLSPMMGLGNPYDL